MWRRRARIALEAVGGLLALVAIVAGVAAWRLSQGPVPLDMLTPRIEAALAERRDIEVDIGRTVLAWTGWPETFALRLDRIEVRAEGTPLAAVPSIDLRLSLPALLNGTIAPTSVTARGASITLVRTAEGFRFGGPTGPEASGDGPLPSPRDSGEISAILPEVLADLLAEPQPRKRLSYLSQFRVAEAEVHFRDELWAAEWDAPAANVVLERTAEGLVGRAELQVALGREPSRLTLDLAYAEDSPDIALAGTIAGLRPADLAQRVPALAATRDVTVPLSGEIALTVGLSGHIGDLRARLEGESGALGWPALLPEPLPVRDVALDLRLSREQDAVTLRNLRIAFGSPDETGPVVTAAGTIVTASGTAGRRDGTLRIEAEAGVEGLEANDLGRYWPPGIQEEGSAREWITANIRNGGVETAEVRVALTAPAGDPARLELGSLEGRMRYRNLDVHYLRPMPPVTGVDGTATFDADSFRFDVAGGRLGEVAVTAAEIAITGMSRSDQFIDIALNTDGPLPATLAPLAHPRLDLLKELGLAPEQTAGHARVAANFAFPLLDDLTMERVEVEAQATLTQVALDGFVLDQDIRDGRLDLKVDKEGMDLSGPVKLAGIPLSMTWRESFGEGVEVQSEIAAQIPSLSSDDRRRLGLDARPYLEGPVSVDLLARTGADGGGRVLAAVNLADAALALPPFDWSKPPENTATAEFEIVLDDGDVQAIRSFTVTAGDGPAGRLQVQGSAAFEAGAVSRVELARFELGRQDLRDVVAVRADSGWRLELPAGRLDARPLLAAPATEAAGPGPPLEIAATRLERVITGKDRYLRDVSLRAERGPEGAWHQINLRATVPARFASGRSGETTDDTAVDGSPITLAYAPAADGRRRLQVTAPNAGAALRALNITDNIDNGVLRVEGSARSADPDSPIDARVDMRQFQVRNAPVLARILTVALLTGIGDVLQGQGLSFQSLTGDVTLDGGKVTTELLHAYGPSLGITVKGSVDLDANTADLRGTIVPAALVNRVLGAIPLLGRLITGGEGEGLIAVTYTVTGSLDDPEVDVNPLSALAPGFLRGLFGGVGEGRPPPEDWPRAFPDQSRGR